MIYKETIRKISPDLSVKKKFALLPSIAAEQIEILSPRLIYDYGFVDNFVFENYL